LLQQQVYEIGLPAATSGEVRVHVKDSDQTGGNRSLDTVYVDQLYIRSENGSGVEPPPPPESNAPNPASWSSVAAVSFGQIDLNWNDNSSDEDGFRIDISSNQIDWSTEDVLAAGQTFYSDTGLPPATTFYYRVVAYKGANNADPTEVRSATTDPENVGAITLSASGYKRKGVKHVILTWSGIGNADIHREDKLEIMSDKASGYDDDIGTKGGGSYLYKVCPVGSSNNCSNEATVVF
jgi:hypothetical protein